MLKRRGQEGPRVAYVMSFFPKITETFVLYEMLALLEQGIQVEVYPLVRTRQKVSHPEVGTLLQRTHSFPFIGWSVLKAQLHFLRKDPAGYLKLLGEVLRETWGSANFFLGALAIFPKSVAFALDMQEKGIDHVHAHFCNHPAACAFIIKRLTGIPFSFTAHGSDLHVERRMLAAKLREADFAVTVSHYNRRLMISECGAQWGKKIHVIHCGVDLAAFTPSGRKGRKGSLEIACVASLEEVKGHRHLLGALVRLRQEGVRFHAYLAGSGPLAGRLRRQIRELGLQERVFLLGLRPRPDILRLLSRVDVLVLPSVPTPEGKREGIPVALMEAMACGLPVVSSRLSGIPELVEEGVCGFLTTPGDEGEICAALKRLADDPDLRRRLGRAARRKVQREFDLRGNARQLQELIMATAAARLPYRWREGYPAALEVPLSSTG